MTEAGKRRPSRGRPTWCPVILLFQICLPMCRQFRDVFTRFSNLVRGRTPRERLQVGMLNLLLLIVAKFINETAGPVPGVVSNDSAVHHLQSLCRNRRVCSFDTIW